MIFRAGGLRRARLAGSGASWGRGLGHRNGGAEGGGGFGAEPWADAAPASDKQHDASPGNSVLEGPGTSVREVPGRTPRCTEFKQRV